MLGTVNTRKGWRRPRKENLRALAAADPAAVNLPNAILEAFGRVPASGCVAVEAMGNVGAITLLVFSEASDTWTYPGTDAASYQKTWNAKGIDFLEADPGQLFYLRSASGTPNIYHGGDPV